MLLEDYTKEQQKINSFPVKKQHLHIGNIVRNVNSGFFTDFNQRLIKDILSRQAISAQLTIYLKKKYFIKKKISIYHDKNYFGRGTFKKYFDPNYFFP